MDIVETIRLKVGELGISKVSEILNSPESSIQNFVAGKKTPAYLVCQKVIDNWFIQPKVEEKLPEPDGSEMKYTIDENGILNGSYAPPEWGRKKALWDGRDVCLCLPVYEKVPQAHHFIMMAMCMKYKMGMRLEFRGDDSMITRSRNHLAKRFLDSGATWSLWFDSDMVFPIGNAGAYATMTGMWKVPEKFLALDTIERLLSWKKTVVGGCYWDRRGSGRLIAGGNAPITTQIPHDSLFPVDFNGTGCLLVHRQVFLDISVKFPETFSTERVGNECGFFTNIQTPERMLGEDESFAKRATEAGHPTYLDLGLCCGHIGSGNIHGLPEKGSKI